MEEGYSLCFNEWALDKEIKNELGLLLIISSLCAEKGYCWAKNEYFSKLFDEPEPTISRKIKKLEEKGYLEIEYERKGCEVLSRKIRLTKMLIHDYQNCEPTINKNVKENIINNNNICSSDKTEPEKDSSALQEEKLEHNFSILWQNYPRKKGKTQAYKHYRAIIKASKLTNQQMLDAITRYKDYLEEQKTKEQYIMHGSTFFCSGIYDYVREDEYD